jgi:hypothetical protein
MEIKDEYTWRSWTLFKLMVAMELFSRGIVDTINDGVHFAESLDMSFEQDYHPESITEWPALIARDADEFEKDMNK